MGFRIRLDTDLCQGHGVCEAEAPDLFAVNEDHVAEILDATPSEEHRAGAQLAVRYCPTHALSIVELD